MHKPQSKHICWLAACLAYVAFSQSDAGIQTKITDEMKIKAIIYRDLLSSFPLKTNREAGTFVVEASSADKAYLNAVLTNDFPGIKVAETNDVLVTANGVYDKSTSRSATILTARLESKTGSAAGAKAGWYSGPEAGGTFKYWLQLKGTNWVIESKELKFVW